MERVPALDAAVLGIIDAWLAGERDSQFIGVAIVETFDEPDASCALVRSVDRASVGTADEFDLLEPGHRF